MLPVSAIVPAIAVVVRLVVHRPEQGEPVGAAGQARQQLADVQPGDRRRDRLERPAVLDRGVRLHVERVEVARPAPEPEHDHGPRRRRCRPRPRARAESKSPSVRPIAPAAPGAGIPCAMARRRSDDRRSRNVASADPPRILARLPRPTYPTARTPPSFRGPNRGRPASMFNSIDEADSSLQPASPYVLRVCPGRSLSGALYDEPRRPRPADKSRHPGRTRDGDRRAATVRERGHPRHQCGPLAHARGSVSVAARPASREHRFGALCRFGCSPRTRRDGRRGFRDRLLVLCRAPRRRPGRSTNDGCDREVE